MRLLFLNYEMPLGTALHATPVFSALKKARPDWEVHVASAGMAYEVLAANPHIDRLWKTPDPLSESWKFIHWALLNRREIPRFDYLFQNAFNQRTRLGLLSRVFPVASRVGYSVHKQLLNGCLKYDDSLSLIRNNLRMLEFVGLDAPGERAPEVWFRREDADRAQAARVEFGEGPLVGIFTATSGGHPNQWYDERFVFLARSLNSKVGAKIVFFGGPKDAESAAALAGRCGDFATSMAGKTSVRHLAAFVSLCDLVVSVDTGGLHVAWAVGTPSVVIGHAANPVHIWLPLDEPRVSVIRKDSSVPCALCRKHFCATRECMDEIGVDEVVKTSLAQLSRFPSDPQSRLARLRRWITPTSNSQ